MESENDKKFHESYENLNLEEMRSLLTLNVVSSETQKSILKQACVEGHLEIAKELLGYGPIVTNKTSRFLFDIAEPILEKVIEYCRYHKNDALQQNDDSWDQEFCKVDQGTLFEMISAAYYLDIQSLVNLTSQEVANMIRGKTPEEIRKQFNIKNDFTPEEEEQIRKENEWFEEN